MLADVIRSFANTETRRFYSTGKSRRLPTEIRARAAMRLTQLDAATGIEDLRLPPSNRLEALKAQRKGQWGIRVDAQWRVCFRFDKGDAFDVEIVVEASAADAPAKAARVGYLSIAPPLGSGASTIGSELAKLGYVEGKNLVIEVRHANGNPDRLPEMAAELVKLDVDVIYAVTNPSGFAAQRATRKIPIVVWGAHGAVETGLVPSLRRPGGNLTGVESLAPELDAKRIELLRQIVPGLTRLAVLYDAGDQGSPLHMKAIEAAGKTLGVAFTTLEVRRPEDFDPMFAAAAGKPLGGVLMLTSNLTFRNGKRVMDFALANRLASLCEFKELAQAGCLLSYGATLGELTQRSAALIGKILEGTPPGELPVEQMTRFELVVNLKTAKALGITVPRSLLVRADEVIE